VLVAPDLLVSNVATAVTVHVCLQESVTMEVAGLPRNVQDGIHITTPAVGMKQSTPQCGMPGA